MKNKTGEKTYEAARKIQGNRRPVKQRRLSRRDFLKGSAAVSLASLAYATNYILFVNLYIDKFNGIFFFSIDRI